MIVDHRPNGRSPGHYDYGGIYVPTEVAHYLVAAMPTPPRRPLRSARVLTWIRAGLLAPEHARTSGRELTIDFEDLVTCQVITLLREAGFSLQQIRQDEKWFANFLSVAKPFAHADFWGAFPDILTKVEGQLLSGSRGGQFAMDFLERYAQPVARRLRFSEQTRRPDSWHPTEGVQLRPVVQLGQPCVGDTRIPTQSIWGYVEAGDPPDFVAQSYGLEIHEVEAAIAWETRVHSNVSMAAAA